MENLDFGLSHGRNFDHLYLNYYRKLGFWPFDHSHFEIVAMAWPKIVDHMTMRLRPYPLLTLKVCTHILAYHTQLSHAKETLYMLLISNFEM